MSVPLAIVVEKVILRSKLWMKEAWFRRDLGVAFSKLECNFVPDFFRGKQGVDVDVNLLTEFLCTPLISIPFSLHEFELSNTKLARAYNKLEYNNVFFLWPI